MSEYTPTVASLREHYVEMTECLLRGYPEGDKSAEECGRQFDRTLASYAAQIKAEALREAAELPIPLGVMNVKSWLRDRAAMIEAGSDR